MNPNRMIELINKLVPEEGTIQNVVEKVNLFKICKTTPRVPLKYESNIIILAQGQKRVFIGDEVFLYDPLHYLVLSVPLPLECETTATSKKPLLGLSIKVDSTTIGEILLTINNNKPIQKSLPLGIYSSPLDNQMIDAATRLLESLKSPADKIFLAPMIVKEIIFRVLQGEKGDALLALANRNQRFFQISRILDKIHESYSIKLDLNSLALESGMSISLFHSSFKAVTNISPLQYIKNVRLHKAKLLMTERGVNAYDAAYQVGYESASQFSREYKRLFGQPPGKDVSTFFNDQSK